MISNLSLQRGKGLYLNPYCTVRHPTLGEIENLDYENYLSGKTDAYGYTKYTQLLTQILLTAEDMADILWFEAKIWYEDIKNAWEFFIQRCLATAKSYEVEFNTEGETQVLQTVAISGLIKEALNYFLNLQGDFVIVQKAIEQSDKKQLLLCNVKEELDSNRILHKKVDNTTFKLTEHYYNQIVQYLKKINWIKEENTLKKAGNKTTKIFILEHNYKQRKKRQPKANITIDSINSALMAKLVNTWELPIYEFYEIYYRYIKINDYDNIMSNIKDLQNPIDFTKIHWGSVINI